MEIYTIGFAGKTAREFFEVLKANGIQQVADVRLNNTSQLAGFTKKSDLEYFLKNCGIDYYHLEFLAPTKEIRDAYNQGKDWSRYVTDYTHLLDERQVMKKLDEEFFRKKTCLLCSEAEPQKCHRRLIAEYLKKSWPGIQIVHIR